MIDDVFNFHPHLLLSIFLSVQMFPRLTKMWNITIVSISLQCICQKKRCGQHHIRDSTREIQRFSCIARFNIYNSHGNCQRGSSQLLLFSCELNKKKSLISNCRMNLLVACTINQYPNSSGFHFQTSSTNVHKDSTLTHFSSFVIHNNWFEYTIISIVNGAFYIKWAHSQ